MTALAELGLTGIVFPEEYGGAGADYISYAIAVEELSRVCASTGVTLSAHLSLCANPIYLFGTEEQKAAVSGAPGHVEKKWALSA